jgi:hypothetical protein
LTDPFSRYSNIATACEQIPILRAPVGDALDDESGAASEPEVVTCGLEG